ncbi:hypothetical protein C8R46DRAFT_1048023 [Mycena filopes]|nr:hypothetical protein C8R46DRAFT_1048023 [Mycena filopes]
MPKAKPKTKRATPLPSRTRTQTPKAKAASKKKKTVVDESSEDSADELDEEDRDVDGVLDIDWKGAPELSEQLLALIAENTDIKRSLYPPCGPNASSAKGGGKPKTGAQWDLAVLLLGNIPKFKDSIAACETPKEKLAYANKIKNRLSAMAKTCRAFNTEMGETGAGIQNAAQIDMAKTNAFTTKWEEISAKCPWYFEMRNLIGQRPNLVPTGLGNSASAVVTGVIIPAPPAPSSPPAVEEEEASNEDEDEDIPIEGWVPTPRNSPQPSASKRKYEDFDDDGAATGSGDEYTPTSPLQSESGGQMVLDDEGLPIGDDDVSKELLGTGKTAGKTASEEGTMVVDDDEQEVVVKKKWKSVKKRVADEDEEEVVVVVKKKSTGEKKKKAENETTTHQNGRTPKPSTSTPALPTPAAAPKPSKKTKLAEFSEIAKSEEKTRQQELTLATIRTRQTITTTEAKGRILEKREDRRREKEEGRREERMMKLRMKESRMRQVHELRMAAARGTAHSSSTSHAGDSFFDNSASRYTPSEPDYAYPDFDDDGFNGNTLASSSTSVAASEPHLDSVLDDPMDFSDLRAFASSAAAGQYL